MPIPTYVLNNDVQTPAVGFGVFQTAPEETAAAVQEALLRQVGRRRIPAGRQGRDLEALASRVGVRGDCCNPAGMAVVGH